MPHAASISRPLTPSWTGIVAYWPTIAWPSRATQISGPVGGTFGFLRYCQSHRSRLASAMSLPNTRRYSASIWRRPRGGIDRFQPCLRSVRRRGAQHVLHVADQRILRQRADPSQRPMGAGHLPHGARDVQFLAHDRAGRRPAICPRSRETVTFSSRSSCFDDALARVADERVLVRRLLQRPRRVTRQETERPERDAAAGDQMQRHGHPQARQMRAGKRQIRRRRQKKRPLGLEHAAAFAQVQRRVGDVLDHRVRQHEIERAVGETAAPCRRPAESGADRGRVRARASRPHRRIDRWDRCR